MRRSLALVPILLWMGLGCDGSGEPAVPPVRPIPSPIRLVDIPDDPVSGTLRGEPFHLADAWLLAVDTPEQERVDLFLDEAPVERCGVPAPDLSRRVWLRIKGRGVLREGDYRTEDRAEPGPLSVHYEVPGAPDWIGVGGGAALLSLEEVEVDAVSGRVQICFDDGLGSCVKGTFRARVCKSEIGLDFKGARHTRVERIRVPHE